MIAPCAIQVVAVPLAVKFRIPLLAAAFLAVPSAAVAATATAAPPLQMPLVQPCSGGGSDSSLALPTVCSTKIDIGAEEGSSLVQARSLAATARAPARLQVAAGAGEAAAHGVRRAAEVCKTDTRLAPQDLAADIIVPAGELCILQNVTLKGAIKAKGSVVLVGCEVTGIIEVISETSGVRVEVVSTNINGGTKIKGGSAEARPRLIFDSSNVGTVEAENVGHIQASNSSVGGLKVEDFDMGLAFRDVRVGDSIQLSGGTGDIDFWGTLVDGGLDIEMCKDCSVNIDFQTELKLGLDIKDSSGSLHMLGTSLAGVGEVSVSGMDGSVWLEGMEVGGISLEGVVGHVYLYRLTIGGPSTFAKSTGILVAELCDFHGELKSNAKFEGLAMKLCYFDKNRVAISDSAGPVLLEGNKDLAVFLTKNHGVTLEGNEITTAGISDNAGALTIRKNVFQDVKCMDNAESPIMQGNIVEGTSHGQCEVKA